MTMDADKLTPDDVAEVRRLCSREYPRGASDYDDLASAALRLLADRDRLAVALAGLRKALTKCKNLATNAWLDHVNAKMLTLGRDSRGLTQGELADAVGISQSKISKYESNVLQISEEDLLKIAKRLDYPPSFFYQEDDVPGGGSGCLYHRKRQNMPVSELRKVQAGIRIMHLEIAHLLRGVEMEEDRFFRMDVDEYAGGPEEIAKTLRAKWGLPPGPVVSLVNAVEKAGGIVFRSPFGTKKLDAMSRWASGLPPLFFVNAEAPADRARWSLAHELGHVIMHRNPSGDQEREADRFAAEFLLPAKDVGPYLKPVSLERVAALKPLWRVSMAALIKRAFDLRKIGESYYRKLFTQLNKLGYRLDEPNSFEPEEPTVIDDLLFVHQRDLEYSEYELSRLVNLHPHEFLARYFPHRPQLRLAD